MKAGYRLTAHAAYEASRRGVTLDQIEAVVNQPQQIVPNAEGRKVYQSKLRITDGRIMLIRLVVEESDDGLVVVTVYRTSKIGKYWSVP